MFTSHIHQKKPPRRPMPEHIGKANAKRSAVRSAVEHVFAGQKHRMGLIVRTIGIARARIKIGMANLDYTSSASPGSKGVLCLLTGKPASAPGSVPKINRSGPQKEAHHALALRLRAITQKSDGFSRCPVVACEPSDVFDRIQCGASGGSGIKVMLGGMTSSADPYHPT